MFQYLIFEFYLFLTLIAIKWLFLYYIDDFFCILLFHVFFLKLFVISRLWLSINFTTKETSHQFERLCPIVTLKIDLTKFYRQCLMCPSTLTHWLSSSGNWSISLECTMLLHLALFIGVEMANALFFSYSCVMTGGWASKALYAYRLRR